MLIGALWIPFKRLGDFPSIAGFLTCVGVIVLKWQRILNFVCFFFSVSFEMSMRFFCFRLLMWWAALINFSNGRPIIRSRWMDLLESSGFELPVVWRHFWAGVCMLSVRGCRELSWPDWGTRLPLVPQTLFRNSSVSSHCFMSLSEIGSTPSQNDGLKSPFESRVLLGRVCNSKSNFCDVY